MSTSSRLEVVRPYDQTLIKAFTEISNLIKVTLTTSAVLPFQNNLIGEGG